MRQAGDDGQTGSERFAPLLLTQVFRAQATPTIAAIYYLGPRGSGYSRNCSGNDIFLKIERIEDVVLKLNIVFVTRLFDNRWK